LATVLQNLIDWQLIYLVPSCLQKSK
jgi:hypothetical protein